LAACAAAALELFHTLEDGVGYRGEIAVPVVRRRRGAPE
jgi:hypothetical protein